MVGQIFFENWVSYSAELPYGPKFLLKLLYLAQFPRYKHFCVLYICKKSVKFKMAAIFWQVKYLLKLGKAIFTDTLWVKNFAEITLSGTVFEIQAFSVL